MAESKDKRVLLRVTDAMDRKIRAFAEIDDRPIQDEIRWLIARGLEHRESEGIKETVVKSRQLLSTDGNSRRDLEKSA